MTAHPYPGLLRTAEALRPDCLLLTESMKASPIQPRAAGLGALVLLGAAALALVYSIVTRAAALGDAVEIALAPEMPQDLIEATRGPQAGIVVEGERAQAINASLPFAVGAIQAAHPFNLAGASMNAQGRALHCLTQAVYYEAAYEPVEGRRAVAQVVLNRVRHPAFPNSVCGVVYDGSSRSTGCQFSFTCDGSLRRQPSAAAWAAAEQVAREALSGQVARSVGTATHYHANYVAPYWAPRLTKLREIGAHIFYTWPGAWGRTAAFSSHYAGVEGVFLQQPAAEAGDAVLAALPADPTDRRAPADVGGRLDVTKGWTLTIPSPDESRGGYSGVLNRQSGSSAPAQSGAATSDVSGVQ
jgi:hypothetical protein